MKTQMACKQKGQCLVKSKQKTSPSSAFCMAGGTPAPRGPSLAHLA